MADPKSPLVAAFLTEGYREGHPDAPPCPQGWVAVMYNRTANIALVLGAHTLWTTVSGNKALVLKGPSFHKAWRGARRSRPNNDSWEDVRLIQKPAFDAVLVALELTR